MKEKNRDYSLERPLQTSQQEPVYLMEAKNGMLVRIPQSKLESWLAAQNSGATPGLTEAEQQLRDRILHDLYGSRK